MKPFTALTTEAICAMTQNATITRVLSDLQDKGWQPEVLKPGVIRMRHPQVETATGYTDILGAREIQKILES